MFYVYELRDPRNGIAFYVGKGQGDRAYQHQREVINGKARINLAKISKIKGILEAGLQVEVCIIAEYDLEEDALDHEFHRIDKDMTLTNVAPGGSGGRSPLSKAVSDLRRAENLLKEIERLFHIHINFPKEMQGTDFTALVSRYSKKLTRDKDIGEMEEFKNRLGLAATLHTPRTPSFSSNNSKKSKRRLNFEHRLNAVRRLVEMRKNDVTMLRKQAQVRRVLCAEKRV